MVTLSKTKLELLKAFQKEIEMDVESLKRYLDKADVYMFNGKVALIARGIQLRAEAMQQYLFPEKEFKPDVEVTDDTAPGETSKLLGVLQVDDVEEVEEEPKHPRGR